MATEKFLIIYVAHFLFLLDSAAINNWQFMFPARPPPLAAPAGVRPSSVHGAPPLVPDLPLT